MQKRRAGARGALGLTLAAATAVVTAATAAVVGGGGPSAAAGSPSSAYGLGASGLVPIEPLPEVVSRDGAPVSDALAEVPGNPLLTASALAVSAENGRATSGVVDLTVGAGVLEQLPDDLGEQLAPVCDQLGQVDFDEVTDSLGQLVVDPLQDALNEGTADSPIDLSAITALDFSRLVPGDLTGLCDVLDGGALVSAAAIEASCTGDGGGVEIVDLRALGLPVEIDTTKANAAVEVPGVLEVTVNRQTQRADGTFSVDALVVDLFGQQEVVIASATCGRVTADRVPDRPDQGDRAPAPDPVRGHLPVTG